MTYAVQQDLIDRFGQQELIEVSDRADPPAGAIDPVVVGEALGDADEVINGYLQAAKITLPLASVPDLVKRWAADIARYFLWKDAPSETVRRNYEDALKALRDVAAGRIALQVGGTAPAQSAEVSADTPGDRIFTRDTMADF